MKKANIDEQMVPVNLPDRERLMVCLEEESLKIDKSRLLSRRVLEEHVRNVLAETGFSEKYLAWGMVILGSCYWKQQVQSVPFERRVLLLPHCLRNQEICPARYDATGLLCQKCGGCDLTELSRKAEQLGYRKILIAEGTPIVVKWILNGEADAILGIGCLKSLERAFEKLLWTGIPAMAVPLNSGTCVDSTVDMNMALKMIEAPFLSAEIVETAEMAETAETTETVETVETSGSRTPQKQVSLNRVSQNRMSLLRGTTAMFQGEAFRRLLPRKRGTDADNGENPPYSDPIATAETMGFDFLVCGGKCFRPFITLVVYHAMKNHLPFDEISDAVKRIAMAIEIFHKASLIHDDIEDDDPYRYGLPTLHHQFGIPAAINTGDYLLGVGYRLIAEQRKELGSDVVADILWKLGDAHVKLSEGQGAELAWQTTERQTVENRVITPVDVLKIYALKTSPAFEAALYAGIRMAEPVTEMKEVEKSLAKFSRMLGIAFQIKNDLDDWIPDEQNKRSAGNDLVGGRPTVLLALAFDGLQPSHQKKLVELVNRSLKNEEEAKKAGEETGMDIEETMDQIHDLYQQADVFVRADELLTKHVLRAEDAIKTVKNRPLREILEYLIDVILR